jgi:hypothetical protein
MLPPHPYALSWHGEAKAVSVLSESAHPNTSNGYLKKKSPKSRIQSVSEEKNYF